MPNSTVPEEQWSSKQMEGILISGHLVRNVSKFFFISSRTIEKENQLNATFLSDNEFQC